jgi:hypothetical protein
VCVRARVGVGTTDQQLGGIAQDWPQASLLVAREIGRCAKRRRAALGTRRGHHRCKRGGALGHFTRRIGGEDDRTMDRDSVGGVGRSAAPLGRSGAHMSDVGAVLLIFVIVAVALTAVRRRR